MTDHDALLRAICDSPDDDIPRLIYADFLEESGDSARAEFVRAQVELARTPDWEPFAVLCRTRRLEWSESGEPFRASLPQLPANAGVDWHPRPFRRGLGWRVNVRSLHTWNAIADRLYEQAPVGELYLNPPATRDDWRRFAAGDWVQHFRIIHLDGTSPVEPIRALCESPAACGITDIHFHRASSPGLPELVEDLLASPLGRGLSGLHFSVGYQAVDELIDAMGRCDTRLDRLSLRTMGMTELRLARLLMTPIVSDLTELVLANDRIPDALEDFTSFWPDPLPRTLRKLRASNCYLDNRDMDALARSSVVRNLNSLDLSGNVAAGAMPFLTSMNATSIRSLSLRACRFSEAACEDLTSGQHWNGLVELDLRENRLSENTLQCLLNAPMPESLVALVVDEHHSPELREKFGERICIGISEPA